MTMAVLLEPTRTTVSMLSRTYSMESPQALQMMARMSAGLVARRAGRARGAALSQPEPIPRISRWAPLSGRSLAASARRRRTRTTFHRLFRQTARRGHTLSVAASPPMMNASMPGAVPCRRLGCAASLRRPWRAVAWHTSRPAASISRALDDGGDVPDAPPPPDPTDDPNDWRYDPKPGSAAMSKVHPASEGPNPYQAGLDWANDKLFTPHRPMFLGRCGVNSK